MVLIPDLGIFSQVPLYRRTTKIMVYSRKQLYMYWRLLITVRAEWTSTFLKFYGQLSRISAISLHSAQTSQAHDARYDLAVSLWTKHKQCIFKDSRGKNFFTRSFWLHQWSNYSKVHTHFMKPYLHISHYCMQWYAATLPSLCFTWDICKKAVFKLFNTLTTFRHIALEQTASV